MKSSFLIFSCLTLLLANCDSIKLIPEDKRIALDQSNVSKIEGYYNNYSSDTTDWKKTTFWDQLIKPIKYDPATRTRSDMQVQVKVENARLIRFTLFEQGNVRDSKVYKYKLKNGIVLIKSRHNRRFQGVPLIFFRQRKETLNLGIDKDSNLIVAHQGNVSGGVFIIVFGAPLSGIHSFVRKSPR